MQQSAKEMSVPQAVKPFCCLPGFLALPRRGNGTPLNHAALFSSLMAIRCKVCRAELPRVCWEYRQRDAFSAVGEGIAVSVYVAVCICTGSVYKEGEFVKCIGIFRDERCYINVN